MFRIYDLSKIMLIVLLSNVIASQSSAAETTGTQPEIGTPYFNVVQVPYLTALNKTGDIMYALMPGKLIKFQLAPFKILDIGSIDFELPPRYLKVQTFSVRYGGSTQMFLSKDEKYLLIYTGHSILKFNIAQKKTVKTLSLAGFVNIKRKIILNGNELVMFDDENRITIWDANTLKQIRQFQSKTPWAEEYDYNGTHVTGLASLNKLGDRIFLLRAGLSTADYFDKLFVFDAKTYQLLVSFELNGRETIPLIAYDLNTLYLKRMSEIYVPGKPVQKCSGALIYHLNSFSYEPVPEDVVLKRWNKSYLLQNIPLSTQVVSVIQVKDMVVAKYQLTFRYKGTGPKKNKVIVYLGHKQAAFWQIHGAQQFLSTENALPYLKMKNAKGEIVPMNQATFNKYHITNRNFMER